MATAEEEGLSPKRWLSRLERVLLSGEECLQRVKELQKLAETPEFYLLSTGHMVRFFTNDLWSGLSEEWRCCLMGLSDSALAALPTAQLVEPCSSASFASFVERVERFSLPRQQTSLACELLANQDGVFIDHQMKPKKSHEVELLAALASQIAQACQVQQVVDVGSGKGYLSETLALQYKLRVVGIDASETNVHGAERRNALLRRFWRGLVRRAERLQGQEGGACKETGKQHGDSVQAKELLLPPCAPAQEQALPEDSRTCAADMRTIGSSSAEYFSSSDPSNGSSRPSACLGEDATHCPLACPPTSDQDLAATCEGRLSSACNTLPDTLPDNCRPAVDRSFVGATHEDGLSSTCKTVTEDRPASRHAVCGNGGAADASAESYSHSVVTGYVQDDGDDFVDFLASNGGDRVDANKPFLLAGLHTCGNLAASSLRLFSRCPALQALCSVGCCYHLVTESEEAELATADGTVEDRRSKTSTKPGHDWRGQGSANPGFPLSETVQQLRPCLGINARMLACQAPDRMTAPGQLPPHTGIFWRAIFQVMLVEKLMKKNASRGNNVGRQFAKSKSFQDYVCRCLAKLQIPQEEVTDEEICQYLERFQPRLRELQVFAQLRAMVSSVIESLILLDRVCFLLEQPNISLAGALPLFDPVTSPRNIVICAVKSRS